MRRTWVTSSSQRALGLLLSSPLSPLPFLTLSSSEEQEGLWILWLETGYILWLDTIQFHHLYWCFLPCLQTLANTCFPLAPGFAALWRVRNCTTALRCTPCLRCGSPTPPPRNTFSSFQKRAPTGRARCVCNMLTEVTKWTTQAAPAWEALISNKLLGLPPFRRTPLLGAWSRWRRYHSAFTHSIGSSSRGLAQRPLHMAAPWSSFLRAHWMKAAGLMCGISEIRLPNLMQF